VKRGLFNLAAAVSLVMMLAAVVLWVRSYWSLDYVWRCDAAGYAIMAMSCRGTFLAYHAGPLDSTAGWHSASERPAEQWLVPLLMRHASRRD
jgi:hypothetical protein